METEQKQNEIIAAILTVAKVSKIDAIVWQSYDGEETKTILNIFRGFCKRLRDIRKSESEL